MYRLCSGDIIATGGFGVVYKTITENGEFVAKKKVFFNEDVTTVEKEANRLSSLKHPNIVRYLWHEVEKRSDTHSLTICMEYANHGSLHKFVTSRESLKLTEILQIFSQILTAVEYIHRMKIIHRDLNERNILIGKGRVVKLCDFGIAKSLISVGTADVAGTFTHMAPELFHGKLYTYETDMWAVGCLLYFLATKSHPFKFNTIIGIMSVINDTAPPPYDAPMSLKDVQNSLLSKDPSLRPSAKSLVCHELFVKYVLLTPFLIESEPDRKGKTLENSEEVDFLKWIKSHCPEDLTDEESRQLSELM